MEFEYINNPEVDQDIFAEELNEEPEQFDTDIFSEENGDGDMFADDEPAQVEQRLDIDAVNSVVTSFSSMLASMLSALTDQPAKRYMPPAQQRRNLAKAIIDAFPRVSMSPAMALMFAIVITYAPVGVTAVQDIKQKKIRENEEGTVRIDTRDQRNGENNIPTQDAK